MKKLLIFMILFFAFMIVTNEVSASNKAFHDVSIYHWAKPNIDHLVALGAIEGFDDGTFGNFVSVCKSGRIIHRIEVV